MVEALKNIVGLQHVLHDGAEKARFSHIWATDIPLTAKGVIFPQTTEHVSEVFCAPHFVWLLHRLDIHLIPQQKTT